MAEKNVREHRHCPFCDEEISEASYPYCDACGLSVLTCPSCGISVARDSEECPNCHANLKEASNKGG
jgi:RNA polymerase subunit RPABC4/transcription elongation factor Spt4